MTDPRPARDLDKIIVRLPDGMRDRLTTVARNQGRSATAEVVQAIEAWLTQDPQRRPGFVHLPEAIRAKVMASAKLQRRSVLDEVVARLGASFEQEDPGHVDDGRHDIQTAIREAMREAVDGLLADPERLRLLGLSPPRRSDDEPLSE